MPVVIAMEEGKHAYAEGRPLMDNPYANCTKESIWWAEGWKMAWWGEKTWRGETEQGA